MINAQKTQSFNVKQVSEFIKLSLQRQGLIVDSEILRPLKKLNIEGIFTLDPCYVMLAVQIFNENVIKSYDKRRLLGEGLIKLSESDIEEAIIATGKNILHKEKSIPESARSIIVADCPFCGGS